MKPQFALFLLLKRDVEMTFWPSMKKYKKIYTDEAENVLFLQ